METPAHQNHAILVADDDEAIQLCIKEIAEVEGWDVAFARDGEQCLQRLQSERPQLLILDHRMPKMTGEDVLNKLDAIDPKLPVIFMTAERDVERFRGYGQIIQLLRKPFDLDAFVSAVNNRIRVS